MVAYRFLTCLPPPVGNVSRTDYTNKLPHTTAEYFTHWKVQGYLPEVDRTNSHLFCLVWVR
jgi:hypothetical protein